MNPLKLGRERLLLLGVVAALGLLLLDRLVLTPVTRAWLLMRDPRADRSPPHFQAWRPTR